MAIFRSQRRCREATPLPGPGYNSRPVAVQSSADAPNNKRHMDATASSIWGWTGRTGVCSIAAGLVFIHGEREHEPTAFAGDSRSSVFTHTLQAFSFRHTRQKMSRVFRSCLFEVKRRMERVCWVVTMHWYDAGV